VDALLDSPDLEPLLALLASDGKLIERPVLVAPDRVLVGFREDG
jgi:arsenate reductase-like glutaredoxin family protein